jgi:hypothetical protein
MTRRPIRSLAPVALAALAIVTLAACGSSGSSGKSSGAGSELVGTFKLATGSCTSTGAAGTYFRMIEPNGTIAKGKFFTNPDSACTDKSYTPVKAGTDGGLVTGSFQPDPSPAFDKTGNALANAIITPAGFTAIKFTLATNKTDPQSKKSVPAPEIRNDNGKLSGQVTAWSAAWNNQYFNQGSPKPDGSSPGLTSPVTGTYDAKTGAFLLTWASQVVGGPFNGFSGYWHLTGTFTAAK